jgi:hypothetical protein
MEEAGWVEEGMVVEVRAEAVRAEVEMAGMVAEAD